MRAVSSHHTPAPGKVSIRLANEEDATSIAGLLTELGYLCSDRQHRQRFKQLNKASCRTFVAASGNMITGLAGFQQTHVDTHDQSVGWILALFVSRQMRRRGVGTALLLRAEQVLRDEGIKDIYLNSTRANLEAHLFYKANGYTDSALRFTKSL